MKTHKNDRKNGFVYKREKVIKQKKLKNDDSLSNVFRLFSSLNLVCFKRICIAFAALFSWCFIILKVWLWGKLNFLATTVLRVTVKKACF